MTQPLDRIGVRVAVILEPVLIAPRGESYHRPVQAWPGQWLEEPRCGIDGGRWVALDLDFAELLDREPCARCWTPDPEQLNLTDKAAGL